MDTITYTLTSITLNFVSEKGKDFGKIVAIGVSVFFLSMVLTGPVPYILPDKVWIICIGILVQGIGGALVNNNCVPALS